MVSVIDSPVQPLSLASRPGQFEPHHLVLIFTGPCPCYLYPFLCIYIPAQSILAYWAPRPPSSQSISIFPTSVSAGVHLPPGLLCLSIAHMLVFLLQFAFRRTCSCLSNSPLSGWHTSLLTNRGRPPHPTTSEINTNKISALRGFPQARATARASS